MKKYKTPIMKPVGLKGGKLLLNGSLGNEGYGISKTSVGWDDENDNNENK